MNGIVHKNTQRIFGYGEGKEKNLTQNIGGEYVASTYDIAVRKIEVYRNTLDDALKISGEFSPETLMLAIDGVPPQAKMIQQRGRRFLSASSRPPNQVFDPNSINPGTTFMFELDTYIKNNLSTLQSQRKLPKYTIYSNHLVPGEGEHKIADHMRKIQTRGKVAVVYGADADLIMIYLLQLNSGWKNIYLLREGRRRQFIDLRAMESIIKQLFKSFDPIDDFVTILMLIGNDFLPHFPQFEITDAALDSLILGYREFITQNPESGICTQSNIIWENFGKYLRFISEKYGTILLKGWGENTLNRIKFPSLVAERCITEYTKISGTETKCVREMDVNKFRDEWYKYIFAPKGVPGAEAVIDQSDLLNIVKKYLEGIAWVYAYYKTGVMNCEWYYPYHYAPVFSDIFYYIEHNSVNWVMEPVGTVGTYATPLEQMLSVMPPASLYILPEPLRVFYTTYIIIYDLYPETFQVDNSGKQEEWMAVPILPMPTPIRIRWALSTLNLSPEFLDLYKPASTLYYGKQY